MIDDDEVGGFIMIRRFLRASLAFGVSQVPGIVPGLVGLVPQRYMIILAPILMAVSKAIRDIKGAGGNEVPWWGKLF